MKSALAGLSVALQFMTRLPIPYRGEWSPRVLQAALLAFVPVGLLIGALLAALQAAGTAYLPRLVMDMAMLSLWIGLTGGLHLDGWMDVADASASQGTLERRRSILKDPHAGSFAVLALFMLLGWKLVLIDVLLQIGQSRPISETIALWLAIPAAARFAAVVLMHKVPPFKQEGLGWLWSRQATSRVMLLSSLWFLPLIIWQPVALVPLAAAGLVLACYAWWCKKRFGGMNGDLTGALIEGTELAALSAAAIWVTG
ncbi:adenosylcobinamide-GDP ribazoletransferase [Xylanibacillus composti]|uniref:Adenosylcobinamide-GDP ribazoletransferase n=1 Tax=Xylanibacillus composti TaxID=1572762 RepID=A0A8J4H1K1_9BACL|nr:adenosylcobinamide-GDP ribazoletransferase [Xylanibacillus composti]GIQ67736.1 adenosylcobinamide-GDP ribazoletransferase [Xylanibacillus composti]